MTEKDINIENEETLNEEPVAETDTGESPERDRRVKDPAAL